MKLREITAPDGKPITIRLLPFPAESQDIGGGTVATAAGYLIAINSNRPRRDQRRALGHELGHVFLRHFERPEGEPVEQIEREARRNAARFYAAYMLRLI